MRWLKFTADGQTSWGIVEKDRVIVVSGDPFGEWQRTPRAHALADVKIELPLMPRTFYCVGLNYLKHLKEAADKRGEVPNVPDRPEIGYRAQNALIAHDEDVVIPAANRGPRGSSSMAVPPDGADAGASGRRREGYVKGKRARGDAAVRRRDTGRWRRGTGRSPAASSAVCSWSGSLTPHGGTRRGRRETRCSLGPSRARAALCAIGG